MCLVCLFHVGSLLSNKRLLLRTPHAAHAHCACVCFVQVVTAPLCRQGNSAPDDALRNTAWFECPCLRRASGFCGAMGCGASAPEPVPPAPVAVAKASRVMCCQSPATREPEEAIVCCALVMQSCRLPATPQGHPCESSTATGTTGLLALPLCLFMQAVRELPHLFVRTQQEAITEEQARLWKKDGGQTDRQAAQRVRTHCLCSLLLRDTKLGSTWRLEIIIFGRSFFSDTLINVIKSVTPSSTPLVASVFGMHPNGIPCTDKSDSSQMEK